MRQPPEGPQRERVPGEFLGVHPDVVLEIGKLTIAGAHLEENIYKCAQAIGLRDVPTSASRTRRARHLPATTVLLAMAAHAGKVGSVRDGLNIGKLVEWCGSAELALHERHDIVHSHYVHSREPRRGLAERATANSRRRASKGRDT